ncbi:hypothetical protein [Tenacibaculum ovolyticum]|uniref:hypothetical protein n=1 Tax=Tenacibaculum ovolyticum TaxID=104270 RepID=UPI003BAB6DC1
MKNSLLSITGATILTRQEQKNLTGGISSVDPSKCGCDCAGRVTGPFYCHKIIACPQVYTCDQEM